MTRFLPTKRLVTPAECRELSRIATVNQCYFVRRSGPNAVLRGWFEGPALADEYEASRRSRILEEIKVAGIRYPLDE